MSFQQPLDKFGNKKDYSALGSAILLQCSGTKTYDGRSLKTFNFDFKSQQLGASVVPTSLLPMAVA
jgi:hypothetical protein